MTFSYFIREILEGEELLTINYTMPNSVGYYKGKADELRYGIYKDIKDKRIDKIKGIVIDGQAYLKVVLP